MLIVDTLLAPLAPGDYVYSVFDECVVSFLRPTFASDAAQARSGWAASSGEREDAGTTRHTHRKRSRGAVSRRG